MIFTFTHDIIKRKSFQLSKKILSKGGVFLRIFVLFGSPNKAGNTACALCEYIKDINADQVDMVYANDVDIMPCQGCNACRDSFKCVLDDFYIIENIYNRALLSDSVIIASPIYFNSVPSQLKHIIDRLQPFYFEKFVHKIKAKTRPNGVLIMCGGAKEKKDTKLILKSQLKYTFDVFGFSLDKFLFVDDTDSMK